MNYQSMVYFKTVAELQHYTRAANALYITQPALSKAIRNLEVELGVALFQKDGRNVRLTPCGRLFYEYVKRSVEEIDQGVQAVRHLADQERNIISISSLYTMYVDLLPEKIIQFRKKCTDCRFSLEYKYTTAILQDVLSGKVELGICSDFNQTAPEYACLNAFRLRDERLVLIVSKNHPLAKRKKVSVRELEDERFIVYIRSHLGSNKTLIDVCARAGFEPNIVAEGYNDYGVFGMVSAGEGIAFISEVTTMNMDSVVTVELDEDPIPHRTIYLIWRKDKKLPAAVVAFRELLCDRGGSKS